MSIFATEGMAGSGREKGSAVALVILVHLALAYAWLNRPEDPAIVMSEMSVSMAMQRAEVVVPPEPVALPPQIKPKVVVDDNAITRKSVEDKPIPVTQPVAQPVAAEPLPPAAAPVVDTEPDYKANYLSNPRPPYPMVARRMGWEGKVVLNVEVLAEGTCGAINVFRSSGRELLDNAALNTVKNWKFVPARSGGRAITKWFRVPINFSLEDGEA